MKTPTLFLQSENDYRCPIEQGEQMYAGLKAMGVPTEMVRFPGESHAFLSNGSFVKGEVFIDLWLGNAETGKRIKRLVKSTFDPKFEELRLLYSQSAFSPDGKLLAFTGQSEGHDVLYLVDVKSRRTVRKFDLDLEGVTGPSWSPDGKRLVFSGNRGGVTDLYVVDADGQNFQQLTKDAYGDLQPQWSPDGKTVAFATDRGTGVPTVLTL